MFESDTLYVIATLLRLWTLLGLMMHVWLHGIKLGANDAILLLIFSGPGAWVANLLNIKDRKDLSNKMIIFRTILAMMLIVPIGWLTCGRW